MLRTLGLNIPKLWACNESQTLGYNWYHNNPSLGELKLVNYKKKKKFLGP